MRNPSRITLLVATVAVAVVASILPPDGARATSRRPPAPGLYAGTITDPDGDPDTYRVHIRVLRARPKRGRTFARISYTQPAEPATGEAALRCRGTLSFRRRSRSRLYVRETIKGGSARECITGGKVVLTLTGRRGLKYRWSKTGVRRSAPTGTLRRGRS